MRTIVRVIYYWIISGFYKSVVKKGNYDIVHLHGCGFADEFLITILKSLNQKFIVTLHGLNSFGASVTLEEGGKRYEKDFLKRVVDGEFPITVISTGIKKTIEEYYKAGDVNNISVICNSFSFGVSGDEKINVRAKYGIPEDAKVLLYVGNIQKNKNQRSLAEAFGKLDNDVAQELYVLFCGRDLGDMDCVNNIIAQNHYPDHCILCGNIDKASMPEYYKQADGVVLLSICEGFGLSLIEGMHYGVPCIASKTIDAFDDVYADFAIIGCEPTDTTMIARSIERLLAKKWDKEKITHHADKFKNESMSKQYIEQYKRVIL